MGLIISSISAPSTCSAFEVSEIKAVGRSSWVLSLLLTFCRKKTRLSGLYFLYCSIPQNFIVTERQTCMLVKATLSIEKQKCLRLNSFLSSWSQKKGDPYIFLLYSGSSKTNSFIPVFMTPFFVDVFYLNVLSSSKVNEIPELVIRWLLTASDPKLTKTATDNLLSDISQRKLLSRDDAFYGISYAP